MKTKRRGRRRCGLPPIGWLLVVTLLSLGIASSVSAVDEDAQPDSAATDLEKVLEESLRRGFEEAKKSAADADADEGGDEGEGAHAGEKTDNKPKGLTKQRRTLDWLHDLHAGQREAQLAGKPLLVLCGSASCIWCERLEKELASDTLQRELDRWTLVYLDIDRSVADAQRLQVAGVPALRLLTPRGTSISARDGYLTAEELQAWLSANYDQATSEPEEVLYSPQPPDEKQVGQLLAYLTAREVATREAAIRRLAAHPSVTSDAVVGSFVEGKLAARLGALEVLSVWEAPVDQMDPWRPETLTEERLARLDGWKGEVPEEQPKSDEPTVLEGERLSDAQTAIDQLLTASETEALVILGRLARHEAALLPEVYERLKSSETDQARERLTALRYHLVASPRRILNWQQGLIALASDDVGTRRTAADQLVEKAAAEDETLLLELFAHPDSLVRELSLRGLQEIGGARSTKSLVKLLQDPEPNVRAAVLKQLTEKPSREMIAPVAEYLETEADADLVVHAVRFLREAKNVDAVEALLAMADHESWQVRAEVAEGLSAVADSSSEAAIQNNIFKALNKMLDDDDGFVVSRAIKGVRSGDVAPVDELVRIIERHPQLATDAIQIMAASDNANSPAIPHLRRLTQHKEASTRAVALEGLFRMAGDDMQLEVLAAIRDEDTKVRQAAASIVFQTHERAREAQQEIVQNADYSTNISDADFTVFEEEDVEPEKSVIGKVFDFLVSGAKQKAAADAAATDEAEVTGEAEAAADGAEADRSDADVAEEPNADESDADGPKEDVSEEDEVDADGSEEVEADEVEADETTTDADTDSDADTNVGETPKVDALFDEGEELGSADEAAATAKTPVVAAPVKVARSPMAIWIDEYRAGTHRAAWLEDAFEPLQAMLAADDLQERASAAAAIIPFGQHDQQAGKILAAVAQDHPGLAYRYSSVLPWLPWDERLELFGNLSTAPIEGYALGGLASQLNATPDPRALPEMWKLFARDEVSTSAAYSLIRNFKQAYFGNEYYDSDSITPALKKRVSTDLRQYLDAEHEWQRTAALVLLVTVDAKQATEKADEIFHDEKNSPQLRDDALRVLLVTQSDDQRTATAVEALGTKEPLLGKTAIAMLAQGIDAVDEVRDYISLSYSTTYSSYGSGAKPIVPKPPKGLTADQVRPYLDSPEPEIAAHAGYLLALLDDPSGLDALIAHWRKENSTYGAWPRLVYRALAYTNDSKYIPVLEEIYEAYVKSDSDYRIREYYWTVRIMTGSEALRLRKRIRAERGMSNLR